MVTNKELVNLINKHQRNPKTHHLTCGDNASHGLLYPYITYKDNVHLVCPDCIWSQKVTDYLRKTLEDLYKDET